MVVNGFGMGYDKDSVLN